MVGKGSGSLERIEFSIKTCQGRRERDAKNLRRLFVRRNREW